MMRLKLFITIFALILPFVAQSRVDVRCLVNTTAFVPFTVNGVVAGYKYESSDPEFATVSFLSSEEYGQSPFSTDEYAIIWFSQTNCAVVKIDNALITSKRKLEVTDLPQVTKGKGLVYGDQVNNSQGNNIRWCINFHDPNNGNEFIDEYLRRRWYSYDPLFI